MNVRLVFSFLLIGASLCFSEVRTITVEGYGEIDTVANVAMVQYSVKGFGPKLRDAVAAATKKNDEITKQILAVGVPKSGIQSSSFYSGQNYFDKSFFSKAKDYQASFSVIIKVDSLNLLSNLIFTISEQDIENLSNVKFVRSDLSIIQAAARDKAIEEVTGLLFPLASEIVATAPDSARALHPETLAELNPERSIHVVAGLREAIEKARTLAPDVVFITGSLFVVGEARVILRGSGF